LRLRLRRGRPIGRFGTEFRCHPCPKSHIRPEFGSTKQARRGPASGAAKCRRFHPRRSKRVVFRPFLACFSAYQPNAFHPLFWAPNVGLFAKKLERRRARDLVHLLQKIWPPPFYGVTICRSRIMSAMLLTRCSAYLHGYSRQ